MAIVTQNPFQRPYATTIVDYLILSFQHKYATGTAFGQIFFKFLSWWYNTNARKQRTLFIPSEDDEMVGELIYSFQEPDTLLLEHTEVDEEYRGQDIGYELVHAAVEHARHHHLKIIPLCSFARAVIDRKPDFADVLA